MVKEVQYTSIKRVLDNLLDHPMLRDLTLEQVVRYTIRFISINGFPKLYEDKVTSVEIKEFRGELPCDLVSIVQVRDFRTGICLRSMTSTIPMGMEDIPNKPEEKDLQNNVREERLKNGMYIPSRRMYLEEPSFKCQGRIIYTSFPDGMIEVAYKSIPVDEEGFPLLIDNENYLAALEAYIKKQVFTVKFDQGKISAAVLQNAQTDYAWLAGQLNSEFTIPSLSEMESLTRMYTTLIKSPHHFDNGFRNLGDREYLHKV